MDKVLPHQGNGPCPCGTSSDAFRVYPEDGHGYCFSGNCSRTNKRFSRRELDRLDVNSEYKKYPEYKEAVEATTVPTSYQYIDVRGVTKGTWERYQSPVKVIGEKPFEIGFKYTETSSKVRNLDKKSFYWKGGTSPGCFGKLAFPVGTFTDIIITEGEFDAPSALQMVGGTKLAAISVSSSSSAVKDVQADHAYINSAQRILLAFDNDKAGQEAAAKVAQLFPFEKVYKVELAAYKDANEYLVNDGAKLFRAAVAAARKFTPDGVISSYDEVLEALNAKKEKAVVSFPFKAGEEKLEGLRFGTSVLFSGREGIGKTEILRKLEHHVLKHTDYNIGLIHLEESKDESLNNLLTYEVGQPLRKKHVDVPVEEKLGHFKKLTGRDNRVFVYSHFGSDDPDDFLWIIRHLVAVCGCKFIFFDHVNFVVSRMRPETDERKMLDYICSSLEKMVEELDFCLVFIAHENDNGETRGSRNISQTCFVRIRLSRDLEAASVTERTKLWMSVAKNRPTSSTGPIGYAIYDESLGALVDVEDTEEFLPPLRDVT